MVERDEARGVSESAVFVFFGVSIFRDTDGSGGRWAFE